MSFVSAGRGGPRGRGGRGAGLAYGRTRKMSSARRGRPRRTLLSIHHGLRRQRGRYLWVGIHGETTGHLARMARGHLDHEPRRRGVGDLVLILVWQLGLLGVHGHVDLGVLLIDKLGILRPHVPVQPGPLWASHGLGVVPLGLSLRDGVWMRWLLPWRLRRHLGRGVIRVV